VEAAPAPDESFSDEVKRKAIDVYQVITE